MEASGMITIKPCPFCGNEEVEIDEVGIGEFAIDCPECRAIGPIVGTVMEAISFWNDRRASDVVTA
jgi:Lar family restriction alleviation protein